MYNQDKLRKIRWVIFGIALAMNVMSLAVYLCNGYWYRAGAIVLLIVALVWVNIAAEKSYRELKRWRQKLREEYGQSKENESE